MSLAARTERLRKDHRYAELLGIVVHDIVGHSQTSSLNYISLYLSRHEPELYRWTTTFNEPLSVTIRRCCDRGCSLRFRLRRRDSNRGGCGRYTSTGPCRSETHRVRNARLERLEAMVDSIVGV